MKRPGYCTLCEKPVFEFRQEKPIHPLDKAWRVDFLLSDDTIASITFCETCLDSLPESQGKIWEIALERYDYEERQRPGRASPEVDAFLAHVHEQHLVREVDRVRWTDLI